MLQIFYANPYLLTNAEVTLRPWVPCEIRHSHNALAGWGKWDSDLDVLAVLCVDRRPAQFRLRQERCQVKLACMGHNARMIAKI